MPEDLFKITPDDLNKLSSGEAVDFFRELLCAEATAFGIGKDTINVPSAINVKDGGIDAEMAGVEATCGQGLIKAGLSCFQIKTGDFSITNGNIEKILFKNDSSELKPKIKSCLDNNGRLVVVLFGWDNPNPVDGSMSDKFIDKLKTIDSKYSNANIEVYGQNKIINFLDPYISLKVKLKGFGGLRFVNHKIWSTEGDMNLPLVKSIDYEDRIKDIEDILRSLGKSRHIRVIDEAGSGKTRFILEATRKEDIAPLVLYIKAAELISSNLLDYLRRDDNKYQVILVVDECDNETRIDLWNKFKNLGDRIKLITIYNEDEIEGLDINYVKIPELAESNIKEIIEGYGIPKNEVERYAEYAGDSPRFAHMIGQNLAQHSDGPGILVDRENVVNRIIAGNDESRSDEVRKRKIVLRAISLFRKFGFNGRLENEARIVHKIVEIDEAQITWSKFKDIVSNLKARKILQGSDTLYITPEALHIIMWQEWWENRDSSFNFNEFIQIIPEESDLRKWFNEMFKFGANSPITSGIVKRLFGENGQFADNEYLKSEIGASFFLNLSEADPESALEYLKNSVGKWTEEELLSFSSGRREIVWALEKIAIWKDLFIDASKLLLRLAQAENESWSNNATGVFKELFSPGYGIVAPTEAPPLDRVPVLEEALGSNSKKARNIALDACYEALESQHFSRSSGHEYQGLRKTPQLWTPKIWKDLFDYYRKIWTMLESLIDQVGADEQNKIIDIFLNRCRELSRIHDLEDMIIGTIENLSHKDYVDKKRILIKVISLLHYEGKNLPPEAVVRWEKIKNDLTGNDFHSLMTRYVGMDVLEDKFDEHGAYTDKTQDKIKELAKQAFADYDLLKPEFAWLMSIDAQNGYRFGEELAKLDENFLLLPKLIEEQKKIIFNQSLYFIGGYCSVLFSKNPEKWQTTLDGLSIDNDFIKLLPELIWRSGMTDKSALLILKILKAGDINTKQLHFFAYGQSINSLSVETINEWLEYLLSRGEYSDVALALLIFQAYYMREDKGAQTKLPKNLTLKLILHNSLLAGDNSRHDQMDSYYWMEIFKRFIDVYPDESLKIAAVIIPNLGKSGSILDGYIPELEASLGYMAKQYPKEVWNIVKEYLDPKKDYNAYHIKQWLRGSNFLTDGEGVITFFPLQEIYEWVDEDVEHRAWWLASFVPKRLFREKDKICWAREVLVKYGEREDVQRNLIANFSTEGWSGPSSLHYQGKKDMLLKFREEEDDEKVKKWIDRYVVHLDEEIKQAEIKEERGNY